MFKEKRWKVMLVLFLAVSFLAAGAFQAHAADDVIRTRARGGHDISTLDPAHMVGNEESNIILAIYSGLVRFDPETSELELDAAEEFEISDDGLVIEFKLREGIQFHDGYGEMTAEDVKFSFERIIDPEQQSEYRDDFATLNRVEVTGRYSGKIILDEPFPGLLTRTLPMQSGCIVSKKAVEEMGDDRFATNPIGSGPYYFSEWLPNQLVILERFDDYFGELPDFRAVEIFPIVDEMAAELSFDRGDLNETRISLESVDRYRAEPDVNVNELTTLRYHWLGFNMAEPPFDDVRVREAVRYAVDVDEILAGAYNNVPERANAMIAEGVMGYWEDAPEYQVDLEKARELLAEAGYPDGFTTEIVTYERPTHLNSCQIAQHHLRRIGIDAEIKIVEHGEAFEYVGQQSHPGMHFMSFTLTLDPGYWTEWFTSDQVGSWNYWKWSNEEFDQLHREANVTMDPDQRAEMYIRMQELMDEDATCIWITHGANLHVSQDYIEPAYFTHLSIYDQWKKVD